MFSLLLSSLRKVEKMAPDNREHLDATIPGAAFMGLLVQ
jgi:hypothetical protein